MQQLHEFNTLTDAKDYHFTQYNLITTGVASQFFGVTGMRNVLETNVDNPTLVQLTPELPQTTLGELCRTILDSAKMTGFTTDPTKTAGALNRAGAAILVSQNLFSQALIDSFFALGEEVIYPYVNKTEHDFALAKGTITRTAITQQDGVVVITTTADCEKHNPNIYRKVTAFGVDKFIRVGTVFGVETAGTYTAEVPRMSPLYIDDHYQVVTQPQV